MRSSDAFLPHRPQVAVVLIKVLNVVGPVYIRLFSLIYAFLAALPYDLFQAAMGLGYAVSSLVGGPLAQRDIRYA